MFNFLKKSPKNQNLESEVLKLTGLDCASCAVDIDITLEELPSVISKTNYAKSETKVTFDPQITHLAQIKSRLKKLGYLNS